MKQKNENNENKKERKNRLLQFIKKNGTIGLISISALPYGGGALTGSILAVSLKINKLRAFISIITGCILGTTLYYFFFYGLETIFKK